MTFLMSLALSFFITVPGIYLLARAKLATSIFELVSTGFFFGFSMLPLVLLGLSKVLPISLIDFLWFAASAVCLNFVIKEVRQQKLPVWMTPFDRIQATIVCLALVLLTLFVVRELSVEIDDDFFIHLPNIKRISIGDIPPHMPYFPDTALRGNIGRDLFIGTVGRYLQLAPVLSVIYVSLAICPFYVLVFHALASRLCLGRRVPTCFCFLGLLFFVSGAIGDYSIRAGCMTYVFNNNLLAWPHFVFIVWLIERAFNAFGKSADFGLLSLLKNNVCTISVCIVAYAGLYFVYISNFLMITLFLGVIPVLAAWAAEKHNLKRMLETSTILAAIISGTFCLHLFVSPLLLERVLISLNVSECNEPMGFVQQAHLRFPKEHLFRICCGYAGTEYPFFSIESMKQQGLPFYAGLLGLFFGLATRQSRLAGLSLFGWLTYIWMLTVDMGEFRAETLRLVVVSHIAFGGACGMLIGYAVEWLLEKASEKAPPLRRLITCLVLFLSGFGCLILGFGNIEKVINRRVWRLSTYAKKICTLQLRQAPDWTYLSPVDSAIFQLMESTYIESFKERLLLRLPCDPYRQRITSAALTGAGLLGFTWEHGTPRMSPELYSYDYRSSLFWLCPSLEILNQLNPDWILVDPSTVDKNVLQDILEFPGIHLVLDIKDNLSQRRILLRYRKSPAPRDNGLNVQRLTFQANAINTSPGKLVQVPVRLDVDAQASRIKLALVVSDSRGRRINVKDEPIVGVAKEGQNDYVLSFSMIQSGRWYIGLVNSQTGRTVNSKSLIVDVESSQSNVSGAFR